MMRRYVWLFGLCCTSFSFASDISPRAKAQDIYAGEAYYYAYQGKYFEALSRLETGFGHLDESSPAPQLSKGLSVDDLEFSYRMHQRAEAVIKSEGNTEKSKRDEAAYRLAGRLLQKGEPKKAQRVIEKITGKVAENIRDDVLFLRAQIHMANGKFGEAATILRGLLGVKGQEGFAAYNLGIALLLDKQEKAGFEQLDKTGLIDSDDDGVLAIKDKANLVLAYRLIENGQPAAAKPYLDRVRLNGPFSNKALLGAGWVEVSQGKFDSALVPWSLLVKRDATDKAVQEAMLGVPYAYAKLDLYGKAAKQYGAALDGFDRELAALNTSIKNIREGKLLQSLLREGQDQDKDWAVKLRNLPEIPATPYLLELMASNDFQEAMRNYLDLDDMRKKLASYDEALEAYEEIVKLRREYYEPLLPDIDRQFQALDSGIKALLARRQSIDGRLKNTLAKPSPDSLVTADERVILERLHQLEEKYKNDDSALADYIRARIRRLSGVLSWKIYITYDKRLIDTQAHRKQLDADEAGFTELYNSYMMMRQAATGSYEGYDDEIRQLRNRVRDAREKVTTLLARQGHQLEVMATKELDQRRDRLDEYRAQIGFALADNYSRVTKAQNAGGAAK